MPYSSHGRSLKLAATLTHRCSISALLWAWSCSLLVGAAVEINLGPPEGKVITALHFGVNAEFFRPGLFFGTLPESDPRSRRAQFARALKLSGIRAIRFPGGNAAYYYLPESRELSMQLAHRCKYWEFREDNEPSTHFVTLENLASFCRDYDIQLVYELPALFYLDGRTPRAVIRSRFSKRANNYDRDRVAEAATYAKTIVLKLLKLRAPVAVWELGNEEFAHCGVEDYARMCAAYSRAIREVDPRTPIVAVGMGKGWLDSLAPRLREHGALSLMRGFNAHYPFGAWPGPGDPARRGAPAAFVSGDLHMERWLDAAAQTRQKLDMADAAISVTETTVMRHKNWEPHAVVGTHAHALVYAWNWLSLLGHRLCDVAVFHDLETPFFGMMRYDVGYDAARCRFAWLRRGETGLKLTRFAGQYVLSPTCTANGLLSRLVGCRARQARVAQAQAALRVLAGEMSDGRFRLIFVVRSPEPCAVQIKGVAVTEAAALTADDLAAVLPGTYRVEALEVQPHAQGSRLVLPPWSVVAAEGRGL